MYRFHASVHARPPAVVPGSSIELRGTTLATLRVAQSDALPFEVTFEQVEQRLSALPRMFLEPDGSFVWVGPSEDRWQVDGNLSDDGVRLRYAELKGTCPATALDKLLDAMGWPRTSLMFQLVHLGVFLAEEEFRRFAETLFVADGSE